jgi:type VI secretion system secreted protein Hcp
MLAIVAAGILSAAYVASVTGGDINPTAPPAPTMRSLDEIYQTVSGVPSDWAPMPTIAQVAGAGAIQDTSVVVGLSHSIVSPRDPVSGLPTGQRMHKPFVITKYIDKATPPLYSALVNNENLPTVILRYYRPDAANRPVVYYTVQLVNANIATIEEGFPNTEKISFTYQKIIWTWTEGGITAEDDWEAPVV